jgi:hypothetical protein
VISEPTVPNAGVNELIVGGSITMKSDALIPVPSTVVTEGRALDAGEGVLEVTDHIVGVFDADGKPECAV